MLKHRHHPKLPPNTKTSQAELEKSTLTRQQQPSPDTSGQINEKNITSDKSAESTTVISDQELLRKRRCENLVVQINAIERRVSDTEDPEKMDQLIVELAQHEKSYSKRCE